MKDTGEKLIKIFEDPIQNAEVKDLARELIRKQILLENELSTMLRKRMGTTNLLSL